MKIILFFLVIICGMWIPVRLTAQIDYKGFPEWSLQQKDSTEYALYTPAHLLPGKKYPVVLFMHGCCGVNNHASLRNAVDPPVRMWHQFGANHQTIPTYIIAPATARGWKQHFANLKAVIDDLIAHQQADPQRIYVTGFSMGGEGTFRIIQAYPGYFAAAIPMGMNFSGDSMKVKGIPIWANQGELDPHAKSLRKQVAAIRQINAGIKDTGSEWITGVFPRYSNFKNVGHGVQWAASSTQDLTGWAYDKINDGNLYPSVYFLPIVNPLLVKAARPVRLQVMAGDPDGSISKVTIAVNHRLYKTLTVAPYNMTLMPAPGDNLVEATAWDKQGKHATATIQVKVQVNPAFTNAVLPAVAAGDSYEAILKAKGNGPILYALDPATVLPEGITLFSNGVLKGVPVQKGIYRIRVTATDENKKQATAVYRIIVKEKKAGEVLVTGAGTDSTRYRVAKIGLGEAPFFDGHDSARTTDLEEINFSDVSGFNGYTFIQTDVNDANKTAGRFMHFTTDEDVMLYVAYEKIDGKTASTIPAWLQSFKKEKQQVVAQYRYFDVYSSPQKKGLVIIPAAAAKENGVSSNYFIMVKKQ